MTAATPPNLLSRLRERGVLRVAASYGVIAWLSVQIASTVFPVFHLPEWSLKLTILVVALGFVPACLLAWFLEATPDGIQVDRQADTIARPRAAGWRRHFDLITIGLLVLVVGYLLIDRSRRAEIGAHAEKSVAVLPFVNMSGDPANEYFSDGLADTVINGLAQLQGLRVSARTSSFQFKNRIEDVRSIGRKLGVATVIEGSVQRSGDKLRVIAQLISTEDGTHLWSKTFDRSSADVFAVQDEIATHIAEALKVAMLTPQGNRPMYHGTSNVDAFDAYARARALIALRTRESVLEALSLMRHAVELDPNFALGYAGLAQAMYFAHNFDLAAIDAADIRKTAERALELAPDLGEAYVPLALSQDQLRPRSEVAALLRKAVDLNPNNAEALKFLSSYVNSTSEGLELLKRAYALDPLSPIICVNLAETYGRLGDLEEGLRWTRRALEINPGFFHAYSVKGELLLTYGNLAEAARWFRARLDRFQPHGYLSSKQELMIASLALGDTAAARGLHEEVVRSGRGPDVALSMAGDLFLEINDRGAAGALLANRSFLDENPSSGMATLLLLVEAGRAREAVERIRQARPSVLAVEGEWDPPFVAGTALALRRSGQEEQAQALLQRGLGYLKPLNFWETHPWNWYPFLWNALLGDTEAAVTGLRTAKEAGVRAGFSYLQRFAIDPNVARALADPRARALIDEMKADVARQLADYQRNPDLPPDAAPPVPPSA